MLSCQDSSLSSCRQEITDRRKAGVASDCVFSGENLSVMVLIGHAVMVFQTTSPKQSVSENVGEIIMSGLTDLL